MAASCSRVMARENTRDPTVHHSMVNLGTILRFAVVNPAALGLIAALQAQPGRATLGGTPRPVDPGAAELVGPI